MCNRLNIRLLLVISCFQWFKDTKNESKSQQTSKAIKLFACCFQWFKDTKNESKSQQERSRVHSVNAVSNGSKILKMKANHNH